MDIKNQGEIFFSGLPELELTEIEESACIKMENTRVVVGSTYILSNLALLAFLNKYNLVNICAL